ncbi:flagellar assembly protein FliH [Desulfotomaculum arcticum]|uniref:Flagellar assembly protein FliH n=1 Tax=Desulfotruncus arcticus DSM 17038 TaxID=1121424 RepID=A0A1I2MZ01_9FIRM|nr:FliH/SctL family protein [Desulfotruncus arcticus]SFF95859.1 flagellar assembly protein FliH [Desulfotomaculum arcticum] [Desulfotruncus arcticus DSM 17038]
MPLSHRIIRNRENGNGSKDLHHLDLRYDFPLKLEEHKKNGKDNSKQETVPVPSEIIEDAERKSKAIILQAHSEASVILEQARAKASAEAEIIKTDATKQGYEQGHKSALDAAAAEAQVIREQAKKVLVQAERARVDQINLLKDEILDLSIEIAEKLVNRHLELQPNAVLDIAREAIQLVGNRQYVVLWVHPDELAVCTNNRDNLMAALSPKAKLQIVTDETIKKGGCIVETDFGKVDATVSARWENLLAVLKGETV